jgi:hypothetical protein
VENFIVTGKKMQTAKENGETILTQKKMSGNKLKQPREIHVREILECLFF